MISNNSLNKFNEGGAAILKEQKINHHKPKLGITIIIPLLRKNLRL